MFVQCLNVYWVNFRTHMYIEGSGAKFWGRPGALPSSPPAADNFAPERLNINVCKVDKGAPE